ncbi:MAG: DUF1682 domain-containing protein [Lachnospiraceae bacterium]|nr:DUF1682 domain-containing protein [Lachnospiraceae bacterium]
MEKMDIQAERRKTEAERTRADEEKRRADEEKRRADEVQKLAYEERRHAGEEKRRADTAEENSVKLLVELCQEFGASRDAAVRSLMDKKNMGYEEALKKTGLYWKGGSES